MKNRRIILSITIDAMFIALLALMSFVSYLGYINIGGFVSFTIIHVVVLIGSSLFGKWKGMLYGFIMGLFSLLVALQNPGTGNFLFVNPFVSILPRTLFGFISGLTFDYFRKRMDLKTFISFNAVFAGFLTILHSFLTLGSLYIFGYLDIFKITQAIGASEIIAQLDSVFGSFMGFVTLFVAIGSAVEVVVAAILTPIVVGVLFKVLNRSRFSELNLIYINQINTINKRKALIGVVCFGIIVFGFIAGAMILYFVNR